MSKNANLKRTWKNDPTDTHYIRETENTSDCVCSYRNGIDCNSIVCCVYALDWLLKITDHMGFDLHSFQWWQNSPWKVEFNNYFFTSSPLFLPKWIHRDKEITQIATKWRWYFNENKTIHVLFYLHKWNKIKTISQLYASNRTVHSDAIVFPHVRCVCARALTTV